MPRTTPLDFVKLLKDLSQGMKQEKGLLPADNNLTARQLYDIDAYAKHHPDESATIATSNRTIMALYNAIKMVSDYLTASIYFWQYPMWWSDLKSCLYAIDTSWVPQIVDEKTLRWGQKYADALCAIVVHDNPFGSLSSFTQGIVSKSRFLAMHETLIRRIGSYTPPEKIADRSSKNLPLAMPEQKKDEKSPAIQPVTRLPVTMSLPTSEAIDSSTDYLEARRELEIKLQRCRAKTSWWDWFWRIDNVFNQLSAEINMLSASLNRGDDNKSLIVSLTIECDYKKNSALAKILKRSLTKYTTSATTANLTAAPIAKDNLKRMLKDTYNHASSWNFLGFGNAFNAMQPHVPAMLKLLESKDTLSADFKKAAAPFRAIAAEQYNKLHFQQQDLIDTLKSHLDSYEKHTPFSPRSNNNPLDLFFDRNHKKENARPAPTPAPIDAIAPTMVASATGGHIVIYKGEEFIGYDYVPPATNTVLSVKRS